MASACVSQVGGDRAHWPVHWHASDPIRIVMRRRRGPGPSEAEVTDRVTGGVFKLSSRIIDLNEVGESRWSDSLEAECGDTRVASSEVLGRTGVAIFQDKNGAGKR